VVDVTGTPTFQNLAVVESGHEIAKTLSDTFHVNAVSLTNTPATTHLDAIVLSTKERRLNANTESALDLALDRVKNDGTRLVLWPDNDLSAEAFARALAKRQIVTYDGFAGNLGAPWFGSWNFVREHWLLAGLPVNCAMDWRYGMSAFNGPGWLHDTPGGTDCEGLMLNAPGMEVFAGYGADHNPKVGVAGCVIPWGKGQIVMYCLPQLVRSLSPGDWAISPVICQQLLGNALRPARP